MTFVKIFKSRLTVNVIMLDLTPIVGLTEVGEGGKLLSGPDPRAERDL